MHPFQNFDLKINQDSYTDDCEHFLETIKKVAYLGGGGSCPASISLLLLFIPTYLFESFSHHNFLELNIYAKQVH